MNLWFHVDTPLWRCLNWCFILRLRTSIFSTLVIRVFFSNFPLVYMYWRCDGREVKALDPKSNGVSPRRFDSCSQRFFSMEPFRPHLIISKEKFKVVDSFLSIWTSAMKIVKTLVILGIEDRLCSLHVIGKLLPIKSGFTPKIWMRYEAVFKALDAKTLCE